MGGRGGDAGDDDDGVVGERPAAEGGGEDRNPESPLPSAAGPPGDKRSATRVDNLVPRIAFNDQTDDKARHKGDTNDADAERAPRSPMP